MTVTALDTTSALVVIDLQAGLTGAPTVHPFADVVGRAAELADAFRAADLPVVLVTAVAGPPGRTAGGVRMGALPEGFSDLVPQLNQQPGDTTIVKRTWGAFHRTDLAEHLTELGVTQVCVVGVATSIGVESTARQAYEHGFHVVLVSDAMTDLDADAHDNSLARIFPKLGEIGTTADILDLVRRRSG